MDAAKFVTVVTLAAVCGVGAARESIPFLLLADHLVVVKGDIGGRSDLNLVVDTGTARTVIDVRVAAQSGLTRTRGTAEVFGQTIPTERLTVSSLAFGPVRTTNVDVLVADLAALERRFGVRLDALLGVDVLRASCLTIDYGARRLAADCTSPLPLTASFTPFLPVIDVSIDGHRYRLIADTGSEAIAVFRTSIPAAAPVVTDGKVTATHLTGTVDLARFTPKRFLVGTHSIGTPPVFVIDTDGRALGYDGVLGTRWLTASKLSFDWSKGLVSWVDLPRKRP